MGDAMLDNRERMTDLRSVVCIAISVVVANACGATAPTPAATNSAPPSVTLATSVPTQANASPTIASGTVTVQLAEHFFTPSLITVKVGTTVVWVDVGQQSHDIHARDGTFESPMLSPGNTYKYTFTKTGKFPYYCVPHEGDGMTGEVDVVD